MDNKDRDNSDKLPADKMTDQPRNFMKARRPALFSDTPSTGKPILPQALFEYHLDTLTARDEHMAFELFCRQLVSKEICPNIKPSTGPTPGGDGKTDAVSYPISEELALRYYTSALDVPFEKRWAFAFSCKEDWKSKATTDIRGIVGLDRDFSRIYFITNRFARKRDRDALEVKLRKELKVDVEILDRLWIVRKVIDNRREELAIEALGIETGQQEKPKLGPIDYQRQQKLDEIEANLQNIDEYYGNDVAIIQDYLRAAELSRGLELPRMWTEGLYLKARQIAESRCDRKLILRAIYNLAWTTYWWFNDRESTAKLYGDMEQSLSDSCDSEDCERFSNILSQIQMCERIGELDSSVALSEERTKRLKKVLVSNAGQQNRPNNALHAETQLLIMDLMESFASGSDCESTFEKLSACLHKADGIGMYPATRFIDCITGIGDIIGHLHGYEGLFEQMREIALKRKGDIDDGELLLQRGHQQANAGDYFGALENIGRARMLLLKEETFQQGLHATLSCVDIYLALDLPWAARTEAMVAAHMALRRVEGDFQYPLEGMLASKRLVWIETELGRIPAVFAWHQLTVGMCNYLVSRKYDMERVHDDLFMHQNVLACLICKIPDSDIERLRGIERYLRGVDMPTAYAALLHRYGDYDTILTETPELFDNSKDEVIRLFELAKIQPAYEQLPSFLPEVSSEYSEYSTTLFGVTYTVRARNRFGTLAFAENLMGIIEAALALAKWENLAFIVDKVTFIVDINSRGENPPKLDLATAPVSAEYELFFAEDIDTWLYNVERGTITGYFRDLLLMVLIHCTVDPQQELIDELDRWHKEDTYSRAIGSSPTIVPLKDSIGSDQYVLDAWK